MVARVLLCSLFLPRSAALAGDVLMQPPAERSSAAIPLVVGGWVSAGATTTLDGLLQGSPKALPVVRAAAYVDVYGVGLFIDDADSWLVGLDHRGNAARDTAFWAVGLYGGSIGGVQRFGVVATASQRTGRWSAEGRGWVVESETKVLLPTSERWNPLGTYLGTDARYAYRLPVGRFAVSPGLRLGVAYDLARGATEIRFGLDVKAAASWDVEDR
jgi:hypothetical protein